MVSAASGYKNTKSSQIGGNFPGAAQLILIDDLPNFPEERIADFFIVVFVVVEHPIAVCVDRTRKHEFHLMLEVDDIGDVREKAIAPSRLVENADIRWDRAAARFEEEEFGIAVEVFGGIIVRVGRFAGKFGHVLIQEPAIVVA